MNAKNKFRITHSLLSSWLWSSQSEERYNDFLKTLRREPTQATQAMRDGQEFENMVYACANGAAVPKNHKWENGVLELGKMLSGSAFQVALGRDITVNDIDFRLFGILDALRFGHIFDVKFSKRYTLGKYRNSTQHSMYFALCPEAADFTYLISDGDYVYRETYYPDETEHISRYIDCFMKSLYRQNLVDLYVKNFKEEW